jgi:hypothetical protein
VAHAVILLDDHEPSDDCESLFIVEATDLQALPRKANS